MKSQTNTAFVKQLMEHSEHGALAQIFIIDAITKHAQRIAETPIEKLRTAFGDASFISADVWQAVAKEIKRKLDSRL